MDADTRIRLAKERDNARFLDLTIAGSSDVDTAVNQIFDEMESSQKTPSRKFVKYRDVLKDHIRVILLNLYSNHRSDPTRYLSYSRSPKWYGSLRKKNSRYTMVTRKYGFDNTIKVIDNLVLNEYVENVMGFRNPDNPIKSRQSRIRATDKLIQLMKDDHQIILPMINIDPEHETIILKAPKKPGQKKAEQMEYQDTPETNRMRENLRIINRALRKAPIGLCVPDDVLIEIHQRLSDNRDSVPDMDSQTNRIDFTRKSLHRVFNNGSFEQCGRFYGGWWQSVPKEYRVYIRIDDKDVVECDYSGLHIRMLYALAKQPYPDDDPYLLEGYPDDLRGPFKRVLNAMINAKTPEKALEAISDHRKEDFRKLPSGKAAKKKIMDAFAKKHKPISGCFCSDMGVRLQYYDSQIAEKVLLSFSRGNKTPALPLHDSFIVHHGLEEILRDRMNKAFSELFGVKPEIDLKYNSILERYKEDQAKASGNDKGPLICDLTIEEMMAIENESSVYYTLLSEHRQVN